MCVHACVCTRVFAHGSNHHEEVSTLCIKPKSLVKKKISFLQVVKILKIFLILFKLLLWKPWDDEYN